MTVSSMEKQYKVHQYDNFYQKDHFNHYRGTYFFNTLEEAISFAKDSNDASKKYGFTSYYVVGDFAMSTETA